MACQAPTWWGNAATVASPGAAALTSGHKEPLVAASPPATRAGAAAQASSPDGCSPPLAASSVSDAADAPSPSSRLPTLLRLPMLDSAGLPDARTRSPPAPSAAMPPRLTPLAGGALSPAYPRCCCCCGGGCSGPAPALAPGGPRGKLPLAWLAAASWAASAAAAAALADRTPPAGPEPGMTPPPAPPPSTFAGRLSVPLMAGSWLYRSTLPSAARSRT